MRDEEFSVHQVDVRLDATETEIERIKQRAGLIVIVMGMCAEEWDRFLGGDSRFCKKKGTYNRNWEQASFHWTSFLFP